VDGIHDGFVQRRIQMQTCNKLTLGLLRASLCLIALFIVACGNSSVQVSFRHAMAAGSKQVLVQPLGDADISTFDPALATDVNSITAINMVFTGLVQLDDELKVQPELAHSYELAPDGLSWTFHLRPGLKFSDGLSLTSRDIAYSIDRALQPTLKSTTAPIYLGLVLDADKLNTGKIKTIIGDSLITPDDSTITIRMRKKTSYFLQALTYPCSYVVERSLIEKYGNAWTNHLSEGGGEGPWKVQKYNHSTGITLVPNQYYHGEKPRLRKQVLAFYKNVDTIYQAYQAGQLSIAGVPAAMLDQARGMAREYQKIPTLSITYIGMNYLVKPFDIIKIRQAFALALNKDVIESRVLKNASLATNHIVPLGMSGYNPNLRGPAGEIGTAGDISKARQLFAEGLREGGYASPAALPPIKLTYPNNSPTSNDITAVCMQMWQSVLGVDVKPDPVDTIALLTEIGSSANNPEGLQMWRFGWVADYPDPQDWLTLQFDKGSPNNTMNYGQNNSSDAVQQQANQVLMRQADVNPDPNARLQQYMRAEQQLVEDVAWFPLTQGVVHRLVKPCVQGLAANAQSLIPPSDWAKIYISTDLPCANATV
jgi:oligopeptide transport system substrate-binding protein